MTDRLFSTFTLEGGAAGLSDARRFVASRLRSWSIPNERIEAVALAATEMLNNALVHAASTPVLRLEEIGASAVRLSVVDCSQLVPQQRAERTDDGHGLGLRMIDELSDSWGWENTADGKVVWACFGGAAQSPAAP